MQSILETSGVLNAIVNGLNAENNKQKKYVEKHGKEYIKGSISQYTKDLIMTFPTMCDNSLPASTASMISRANERNIVTMLELLFASIQLNGNNGAEILSRIHKNINVSMDMDDIIDALDNISKGNLKESVEIRDAARALTEALKKTQKSFPVNSFSENSLNDYLVYNIYGKIVVREDKSDKSVEEELNRKKQDEQDSFYAGNKSYRDAEEFKMKRNEDRRKDREELRKEKEYNDKKESEELRRKADEISKGDMQTKNQVDMLGKVLIDQDVKKANELTPSLMIIRYNELGKDSEVLTKNTFVAGVKSRLISVDASDIIDRLVAKNKTKLSFLNLVRATTGEISFINDFILCTKQAKIDAKNSVKKGPAAKMWKVLEYRGTKNNRNKIRKAGNDASAITTLIINQETVNLMKKEYDFDLETVANTKMIMDAYNLLGICICDESIEVAKFFYAGNDLYETQAYSFLEKEGKDSSYKKIINLLNSNGR